MTLCDGGGLPTLVDADRGSRLRCRASSQHAFSMAHSPEKLLAMA